MPGHTPSLFPTFTLQPNLVLGMCIEAAFCESGSTCDHIDQRMSDITMVIEQSTSSEVRLIGALFIAYLRKKPLKNIDLLGKENTVYDMLSAVSDAPKNYALFLSHFKKSFGFVTPVGDMDVTEDDRGVGLVPFGSQSPSRVRRPQPVRRSPQEFSPAHGGFSGRSLFVLGSNSLDEGIGGSLTSSTPASAP